MRALALLLLFTACDGVFDNAAVVCPLVYRASLDAPFVRDELRLQEGGDEETVVLGSIRITATYVAPPDHALTVDVSTDRWPLSRSRFVLPPDTSTPPPLFPDGTFTGLRTETVPGSSEELTWSCESTRAGP